MLAGACPPSARNGVADKHHKSLQEKALDGAPRAWDVWICSNADGMTGTQDVMQGHGSDRRLTRGSYF
jgi:hypothetical protein